MNIEFEARNFRSNPLTMEAVRTLLDSLANERYLPKEELEETFRILRKAHEREKLTEEEKKRGDYLFPMVQSAAAHMTYDKYGYLISPGLSHFFPVGPNFGYWWSASFVRGAGKTHKS